MGAASAAIDVYLDTPFSTTTLLAQGTVPALAAGASTIYSTVLPTLPAGQHTIYLAVNPDHAVQEVSYANNIASITLTTQTLQLAAGWNLITLPLSPTTPLDAQAVLTSLISTTHGRYAEIDAYTNGQFSPSLYDDPGDGLGIGGKNVTLQLGQGYALYTDTASSIPITGTPVTSATSITLAAGWNLVGFPGAGATTYKAFDILSNLLAATQGKYAEIDSYSNGQFSPSAYDDPGDGLGLGGSNFTIQPGQGYALYTDTSTMLNPTTSP